MQTITWLLTVKAVDNASGHVCVATDRLSVPIMPCRAVFESAEKLEAVSAVREYENLQRADSPQESLGLLQEVVYDAGARCASLVGHPSTEPLAHVLSC